jgi:multidrug efflux system membrane fusion protein
MFWHTASRIAGLLTATAMAAACAAGGESLPAAAAQPSGPGPAVPVDAAPAVQKSMPLELTAVGTAEAYTTVAVHAQITGELTSVNFKDGDDVTKGQVLFTLDKRPLEAALRQAEANLERDVAQAANARSQLKRYQDLAAQGIATREQVDQNATNATALDATVEADRAAAENARVQLQYATIIGPVSGRTGKLMVHGGNLVRANDTMPLVVINQISPIYVTFGIPETELTTFKKYMAAGTLSVEARAPGDTARPAIGRVSFVDNAVDQTTGTISIRGTFSNTDHRLWPGQFVNVTVTLTTDSNVVVVPSAAIQTGQQGAYVFVVKGDQTVEMRPVAVQRAAGAETILKRGVSAGETVVTEGQLRLVSGTRITLKKQVQAGSKS